MIMRNYDDPAVEERWCEERRTQVTEYLQHEAVEHGGVSEWPAWHVAPYVSVWAIESKIRPGMVGWWAICGDMPTDYVSAAKIKHPREAVRAIAQGWREHATLMARGEAHADTQIGQREDWFTVPVFNQHGNTVRYQEPVSRADLSNNAA